MSLIRVRRAAVVAGAVLLSIVVQPAQGAAQGSPYRNPCTSGAIVGLEGWQGWWMDGVRAVCSPVNVTTGQISTSTTRTAVAGTAKGTTIPPRCPPGTVLTGYTGSKGTYVNTIHSLRCSPVEAGGMATATGVWVNGFPQKPNSQGNFIARDCTGGRVAVAIVGRAATYLDGFDIECVHLPGATTTTTSSTSSTTLQPRTTELAPRTAIITPAAVTLLEPASGIQIRGYNSSDPCANAQVLPAFRWQAVTGAERYILELRNNTRNTVRTFSNTGTQQTATRLMLIAGNNYSWRVRGVNAFGTTGPWSSARGITAITPPPSNATGCVLSSASYPIF